MEEGRALEAVGDCTSSLHSVGHAWRSAGEHTNLRQKAVLFLETVKELVEIWSPKVSDGPQSSEETATRQLLEVTLTDVLRKQKTSVGKG